MSSYILMLNLLNRPSSADVLSKHNFDVMMGAVEVPYASYGFPPALIPIWSTDYPSYIGYWKHWFVSRPINIVKLILEAKCCYEIALNEDQLIAIYMQMDIAREGLTEEVVKNAKLLNFKYLYEVALLVEREGEDASALANTLLFNRKPQEVLDLRNLTAAEPYDIYKENHPIPYYSKYSDEELYSMCSYEFESDTLKRFEERLGTPPWLLHKRSKADLFYEYIEKRQLDYAWLTLNSTGWTFVEARNAISRLAESSQDPLFERLAEIWIAEPHDMYTNSY